MVGLSLVPKNGGRNSKLIASLCIRFSSDFYRRSLSSQSNGLPACLIKKNAIQRCFRLTKNDATKVISLYRASGILLMPNNRACLFEFNLPKHYYSTESSASNKKSTTTTDAESSSDDRKIFAESESSKKSAEEAAESSTAAGEDKKFGDSAKHAEESEFSPAAMEQERAENYRKTWRRLKMSAYGFGVLFISMTSGFVYLYGSKRYDDLGNEVKDQFTDLPFIKQLFSRAWFEAWLFVKSVHEPSRDKLLPDPLKEPYYQPKYTVVLELSGLLVHPDWTFNTGWRFKKRPGVEYFLKALGYPRTELVVYTSENGMTAQPIIESLDTDNVIMYKLYRDTTKYQYKDGAHIKDLSKLNRDLSKVIYVDWDTKAFQLNPDNALRVPKWTGDDDDLGLIDLANLIRTIVDSDVQDVRPVLQYYSSCDDPLHEFRENQRKLIEIEQAKVRNLYHEESLTKSWTGRLFGFKRHS